MFIGLSVKQTGNRLRLGMAAVLAAQQLFWIAMARVYCLFLIFQRI